MASRGRGRPRLLTLEEIRMRNAAEYKKKEKPGGGNSLKELRRRYAGKIKRSLYV